MRRAEAECLSQCGRPARFGVARKRVDQVEADPSEVSLRDLERPPPLPCGMRPAQEAEHLVVEALQPKRQPVNACRSEIGKTRGLDRVWIGLERDLDVLRRAPMLAGRIDYRGDGRWHHQRGGATAEEDRGQPASWKKRGFVRKVGEQRLAPRILVDR